MESSIAEFLRRWLACELPPTTVPINTFAVQPPWAELVQCCLLLGCVYHPLPLRLGCRAKLGGPLPLRLGLRAKLGGPLPLGLGCWAKLGGTRKAQQWYHMKAWW